MAPIILRVSWYSFSSCQWGLMWLSSVAILLWALSQMVCRAMSPGCSLTRLSPAWKHLIWPAWLRHKSAL